MACTPSGRPPWSLWPSSRKLGVAESGGRKLLAPDRAVVVAIPVLRIEAVVLAAVLIDVVPRHQVRLGDESAPLVAREGAIEFVDRHPALHVERLGHRGDLVRALLD